MSQSDKGEVRYAELGWTSASLWVGNDLFFFDNAFNRVAKASLGKPPAQDGLDNLVQPALIRNENGNPLRPGYLKYAYPKDDGFIFFDAGKNVLAEVGPDLNVVRQIKTSNILPTPLKVSTLYRFAVVGDGVLAFADIEDSSKANIAEKQYSSFVLLDFEGRSSLIGDPIPHWSNLRARSLRDFQFITSVDGETAHVLVMDDEPWVARVSWSEPRLERLARVFQSAHLSEYSELPAIRWFYDPKEVFLSQESPGLLVLNTQWYRFYRDTEETKMLSGLVSWQGRLFLLAKEGIDPLRGTEWWLLEINPEDGQFQGRHLLPSRAESVLLAPTVDRLGFVEKGGIQKIGTYPDLRLFRPAPTVKRVESDLLRHEKVSEVYCRSVTR